ncbi:CamS family sex pheromone protein [Brevibacillus fulvus]|uniref:Protein involved in sex pheromone biosynthesis n=1 Tax=Brevibacillus fulvus TaxID=1125967 RepID=A0A938Y0W2_9BACL|nr:CamS family sex pheromone protein [Brevibacillus fulvus]MBM7589542.1 protein involved in sex pheromone biosynthesis [Brevibacillus fulvus]
MWKITKGFIAAGMVLTLSFVATACSYLPVFTKKAPEPATPSVSPVIEVSEDYYGSMPPYKENQTRGMLSGSGYRIDFSRLELGLMEIAQETFPTPDYYFQEGQQIKREQAEAWLARTKDNPAGLNPNKGPNLLVNILEHDYLDKDQQKLAGMVVGLSLSPDYQDGTEQEKQYTAEQLVAKGEQLAARIVQTVKAQNPGIPMVIALYQVPDENSTLIPGHFLATGTVGAEESSVSKWQMLDEQYYLFPSEEVEKDYPQAYLQYDKLMRQTQSYFGEYVGITGVGRFMNGKLTELTITANAEYDSRTEVLQFTQFAANGINQLIDKDVHVNLYVQSINRPLAIYVRPANGEPYMHIYRN